MGETIDTSAQATRGAGRRSKWPTVALVGASIAMAVVLVGNWNGYHGGGEIVPLLWILLAMSLDVDAMVIGLLEARKHTGITVWIPAAGGLLLAGSIVALYPDLWRLWLLAVPVGAVLHLISRLFRLAARPVTE
jgi:hypothetical protein